MIQHVFINSNIDVVSNPAAPDEGKVITIVDKDTGHMYNFPMPQEIAKIIGSKLMGIGELEVVSGDAARKINGKGPLL